MLDFLDDIDEYVFWLFVYKIWWKNLVDNLVFSFECDNSIFDLFLYVVYVKKDSILISLDYEWIKIII